MQAGSSPSSYIVIDRKWKDGDVVEIRTPMKVRIEELPNVPNYISFLRGPILLGAKTGNQHLDGLVADDGRWAHIASGPLVSMLDAPFIIGDREEIQVKLDKMQPVPGHPFCYTVPGLFRNESGKDLILEPFYRIHDSRYMMYWLSMTAKEYEERQKQMWEEEQKKLILDRRTVDAVAPGEQQPEVDHLMKSENSFTGNFEGENWRDARDGGYFQYNLMTKGEKDLSLMVRYWGNESASRAFDILIDGELLVTENTVGKWNQSTQINVEYKIPVEWVKEKESVTVTFRSHPGNTAGGVFYVRLVRNVGF